MLMLRESTSATAIEADPKTLTKQGSRGGVTKKFQSLKTKFFKPFTSRKNKKVIVDPESDGTPHSSSPIHPSAPSRSEPLKIMPSFLRLFGKKKSVDDSLALSDSWVITNPGTAPFLDAFDDSISAQIENDSTNSAYDLQDRNLDHDNALDLFPFRSSLDLATSKVHSKCIPAPAMEDEESTYQPHFRPSNPEPPRFRLGVPAVVSLQAWAYELRHRRRFHVPSSPLHKGPITNKPLAQLPALAPRYRRNNKPSMSELVSDEDDNSRFGLDQSLSDTAPTEVHSLFSMKCYSESHDDQSAESTSDHDTGYLTSGPVGALATPSVYYTPHETSTIPPPASEEFALPASNPRADNEQAGPSAIRGRHNCGPQGVISQYKTYFDTVRKSRVQEKIAKGKKREQRAEKYLEQYK